MIVQLIRLLGNLLSSLALMFYALVLGYISYTYIMKIRRCKYGATGELVNIRILQKNEGDGWDRKIRRKYVYTASEEHKVRRGDKHQRYAGSYDFYVNGTAYHYCWNQLFFRSLPAMKCIIYYDKRFPNVCFTSKEKNIYTKMFYAMWAVILLHFILLFIF